MYHTTQRHKPKDRIFILNAVRTGFFCLIIWSACVTGPRQKGQKLRQQLWAGWWEMWTTLPLQVGLKTANPESTRGCTTQPNGLVHIVAPLNNITLCLRVAEGGFTVMITINCLLGCYVQQPGKYVPTFHSNMLQASIFQNTQSHPKGQ
jgi:hypothetical protein